LIPFRISAFLKNTIFYGNFLFAPVRHRAEKKQKQAKKSLKQLYYFLQSKQKKIFCFEPVVSASKKYQLVSKRDFLRKERLVLLKFHFV
jgi:hypothetical protein